jgi:hypothetical protein
MNNISSCCYRPPDRLKILPDNWTYESAQIEKTAIAGEQSADIVIQTADGDKLTLSSEVKFESSAITYEELGRTSTNYSKSQGRMMSASASGKFELTVEGTLDEQEKKEIKEVLMNLFKMVKDFIAGKANAGETNKFAHLTTISAVKAEFDINAGMATAAQSYANLVAQTPLEEKQAVPETQTINLPPVPERVDELTNRMIRLVKDSGIEPSRILKRLNRQLSRRSNKFMHARLPYWHKMRLRKAILEDLAAKLRKLSFGTQKKMNANDQSGVEKAASLNEPAFLETTASASETLLNIAGQDLHFEVEYSVADDN